MAGRLPAIAVAVFVLTASALALDGSSDAPATRAAPVTVGGLASPVPRYADDLVYVTAPEKIAAIDDPTFGRADGTTIPGDEPVLSLEVAGEARAYPLRILLFHEIVNDVVGGTPVVVTYCPLCNTGSRSIVASTAADR